MYWNSASRKLTWAAEKAGREWREYEQKPKGQGASVCTKSPAPVAPPLEIKAANTHTDQQVAGWARGITRKDDRQTTNEQTVEVADENGIRRSVYDVRETN